MSATLRKVEELQAEIDSLHEQDQVDSQKLKRSPTIGPSARKLAKPVWTDKIFEEERARMEAERLQRGAARQVKKTRIQELMQHLEKLQQESRRREERESERRRQYEEKGEKARREQEEAERRAAEERLRKEREEASRKAEREKQRQYEEEAARKTEAERLERERAEGARRAEEERLKAEKEESARHAEAERARKEREEAARKAEEERLKNEKAEAAHRADAERARKARERADCEAEVERLREARDEAERLYLRAKSRIDELRKRKEARQSICPHNCYWEKEERRSECACCKRILYTFGYECPDCVMMACAGCMMRLKGKKRRPL